LFQDPQATFRRSPIYEFAEKGRIGSERRHQRMSQTIIRLIVLIKKVLTTER
jgi:hypothetical protein